MNTKTKNSLKSKDPDRDWLRFMHSADAFFVSYAATPLMIEVTLFLIGHAVELYLKAAYTKQTCDIDGAIRFGHDIEKLFAACKKNDPQFMKVFNSKKGAPDIYNLMKHREFFVIADKLSDLKYLGAPRKKITNIGAEFQNDDWIEFVREIRLYLKYPSEGDIDTLKCYAERIEENVSAKRFIEQVFK
jgi:hypothetical protein